MREAFGDDVKSYSADCSAVTIRKNYPPIHQTPRKPRYTGRLRLVYSCSDTTPTIHHTIHQDRESTLKNFGCSVGVVFDQLYTIVNPFIHRHLKAVWCIGGQFLEKTFKVLITSELLLGVKSLSNPNQEKSPSKLLERVTQTTRMLCSFQHCILIHLLVGGMVSVQVSVKSRHSPSANTLYIDVSGHLGEYGEYLLKFSIFNQETVLWIAVF